MHTAPLTCKLCHVNIYTSHRKGWAYISSPEHWWAREGGRAWGWCALLHCVEDEDHLPLLPRQTLRADSVRPAHITSHHITSNHVKSRHLTSHHVTSHRATSWVCAHAVRMRCAYVLCTARASEPGLDVQAARVKIVHGRVDLSGTGKADTPQLRRQCEYSAYPLPFCSPLRQPTASFLTPAD